MYLSLVLEEYHHHEDSSPNQQSPIRISLSPNNFTDDALSDSFPPVEFRAIKILVSLSNEDRYSLLLLSSFIF